MITAAEAQSITAGTITEEAANHLMEGIEAMIRMCASQGKSYASIEASNFTDAERAYVRKKCGESGFTVSEVGFTIYW